jgi:hypothetical protein
LKDDVVVKVREFTAERGVDVALIMADAKNIFDQASSLVSIELILEKIELFYKEV